MRALLRLLAQSSPSGGGGPSEGWGRGTGRPRPAAESEPAEGAPPPPFGWVPSPFRGGSLAVLLLAIILIPVAGTFAADGETAVERDYSRVIVPPAPAGQTIEQVSAKSDGCYSCHVRTDAPTMHESPAVRLGCTDCHGGDATVTGNSDLPHDDLTYVAARERAHVLP